MNTEEAMYEGIFLTTEMLSKHPAGWKYLFSTVECPGTGCMISSSLQKKPLLNMVVVLLIIGVGKPTEI
jgi:hypothetical protein